MNPYSASGARNPGYQAAGTGMNFQDVLNMGIDVKALQQMLSKGKGGVAGLAGKYGPTVAKGVTRGAPLVGAGISLLQGDVGGAVGAGLGGVLGSALGPVGAVGGSVVGGMLGSAVQSGIGGLVSGGQERQLARGESPTALGLGSGQGVGFDQNSIDMMGQMTQQQLDQKLAYLQATNPIQQANLDRQHHRYLQQVQQQGQITGALNRQMYMAQLAGNAQAQAGETNRAVLTASNPYVGKIFG